MIFLLKHTISSFLLFGLLTAFTNTTSAATIYVDVNVVGGGLVDGTSWANAYTDLQPALTAATTGDQIWVAAGTYLPTVAFDPNGGGGVTARFQTFYLATDGVEVYGGFAGGETTLGARNVTANLTILSGEIGAAGLADNAYHVMVIDGVNGPSITTATLIDGFQITGGNADGSGQNNSGGGLFNYGEGAGNNCSPTIRDCRFVQNLATYGGAMFNNGFSGGTSSPSVANCRFSQNTVTNNGGAMFSHGFGGTSSPSVTNCSFSQNSASNGGAVFNSGEVGGTSNPIVINCSFSKNTVTNNGGAMYNSGDSGNCSPSITNCSFSQNTAVNGGALLNNGINGGISNPTITNSIFWGAGSGSDLIVNNMATGSITYSIYEQGVATIAGMTDGGNNLATDPLFTNAATGDLSLQLGSPAIDAGNDALNSTTTDLANNPRKDGVIDMGAFEFVPVVMPPATAIPTLSQWGMILLTLILMIATGLLYSFAPQITPNSSSQTGGLAQLCRNSSIPFNSKQFLQLLPWVAVGFALVFTLASTCFAYEPTTADPFGGLLSIPLVAYLWFLLDNMGRK